MFFLMLLFKAPAGAVVGLHRYVGRKVQKGRHGNREFLGIVIFKNNSIGLFPPDSDKRNLQPISVILIVDPGDFVVAYQLESSELLVTPSAFEFYFKLKSQLVIFILDRLAMLEPFVGNDIS